MAHPFESKAMTGQERADSRYSFPSNNSTPEDPLMTAARKNTRESDGPEEVFNGSPARQASNFGKVRK